MLAWSILIAAVPPQANTNPKPPNLQWLSISDYSHLTLDPVTAHSLLSLSEGKRKVTRTKTPQSYPDHPKRFDYWEQVLCREGLSGRHYWEVEWSGKGHVYIAVSYEGIVRRGWGYDASFGYNNKSWSLCCYPSKYFFYHNQKFTRLLTPFTASSRIGVYLDHRAGTLSFYRVSDTMTLLHRVQTTFTQPVYPGFYANTAGSTIKLCSVGWAVSQLLGLWPGRHTLHHTLFRWHVYPKWLTVDSTKQDTTPPGAMWG